MVAGEEGDAWAAECGGFAREALLNNPTLVLEIVCIYRPSRGITMCGELLLCGVVGEDGECRFGVNCGDGSGRMTCVCDAGRAVEEFYRLYLSSNPSQCVGRYVGC